MITIDQFDALDLPERCDWELREGQVVGTKSIVSKVLRCTGVGVRPIRMVRSTLDTIR